MFEHLTRHTRAIKRITKRDTFQEMWISFFNYVNNQNQDLVKPTAQSSWWRGYDK